MHGCVLLRFLLVGVVNTIMGYATLFALYNFAGLGYWPATATSYAATIIISFVLNKYYAFSVKHFTLKQFASFVACVSCSYGLAYSFAMLIIGLAAGNTSKTYQDNGAMLVGMLVFTCLNYAGQRFIVFSSEKEK
jgi:putative flippase GtrA